MPTILKNKLCLYSCRTSLGAAHGLTVPLKQNLLKDTTLWMLDVLLRECTDGVDKVESVAD